jgi:fatty acid desaturase
VLWFAGSDWPWIIGGMLLRGSVISVLDNAPHYGTSVDSGQDATNSLAPGPVRAMLLNQNMHGVHHARPNLPWSALPRAFAEAGARYDVKWSRMVLRQFEGPMETRHGANEEGASVSRRAATSV